MYNVGDVREILTIYTYSYTYTYIIIICTIMYTFAGIQSRRIIVQTSNVRDVA